MMVGKGPPPLGLAQIKRIRSLSRFTSSDQVSMVGAGFLG